VRHGTLRMSINDGDAGHGHGCGRARDAGAEQPGDGGDVAVDFTAGGARGVRCDHIRTSCVLAALRMCATEP
jgi:hypothetical protein